MRILYVAKHESGGNDDEGAIAFALEKLGHGVIYLKESEFFGQIIPDYDFSLVHKPPVEIVQFLKRRGLPSVFWYFDLVDWPSDPTLKDRCDARKGWMADVMPLVDIGFCTDGDWVDRVHGWGLKDKDKLHVLRQGADERVVGFGTKQGSVYDTDVLFVGGVKGCGVQRESFLAALQERYAGRFMHVGKGVYGRSLANLVASAKVVVCPDSPVTDRYWSNRVYVLGGFGACILHPRITDPDLPLGVLMYSNRELLFGEIDRLLKSEGDMQLASNAALRDVTSSHLYHHRCEELIRVVKEQLGV